MKLVSKNDTYEKIYKDGEEEIVFTLKKLSAKEVNDILDQTTATEVTPTGVKTKFLGGVARQQKINKALVEWKGITDDSGAAVSCNDTNKEQLPPKIQFWLEGDINKVNGFEISEDERKNS